MCVEVRGGQWMGEEEEEGIVSTYFSPFHLLYNFLFCLSFFLLMQ